MMRQSISYAAYCSSPGRRWIHLGHNRSVYEIVRTALQEDVQGIAVSSYQGGHVEYFKYMLDMLRENDAGHIKVFGGGGGVIVPDEIQELHEYGVQRIYSPEDGHNLGLQGMIDDMLEAGSFDICSVRPVAPEELRNGDEITLSRVISAIENNRYTPDKGESARPPDAREGQGYTRAGYYRYGRRRQILAHR